MASLDHYEPLLLYDLGVIIWPQDPSDYGLCDPYCRRVTSGLIYAFLKAEQAL